MPYNFGDEEFAGDNLIRANDVEDQVRIVDIWKIVAKAYRKPGSPVLYWKATTGGNDYGPYMKMDDLFQRIADQIGMENDRASKRYRFATQKDRVGRKKGAD